MKKLLVVSHTEHFLDAHGIPHGWRSTVNELDFIAAQGYAITHLAVLHPGTPPPATAAYTHSNVTFVQLPPFGGPGWANKLKIVFAAFVMLRKVFQLLPSHDVFQFRAPTSIGVFLIPALTLFSTKKGWYKYAGNWQQPNMPWSYRIQKWMLLKQSRAVTINGKWTQQPSHCFSFENPCITEAERLELREKALQKDFSGKLDCVFIGRLDKAKGVDRILDWATGAVSEKIGTLHLIGDSEERKTYEAFASTHATIPVVFHGFQSRDQVFQRLLQSQFLLLPSLSEGFPKVVAEAAACGCIPVVSDVSALGQYITPEVGFLYPLEQSFPVFMKYIDESTSLRQYSQLHQNALVLAQRFTFENYFNRLKNEIQVL